MHTIYRKNGLQKTIYGVNILLNIFLQMEKFVVSISFWQKPKAVF